MRVIAQHYAASILIFQSVAMDGATTTVLYKIDRNKISLSTYFPG